MKTGTNSALRAMVFAMALLFATAGNAAAVSLISISPAGDGVFTLQGTAMDGAAAADITLSYDATALENPRVTQGPLIAGAMVAENPNTPGIVRLAIIRLTPFSGSGTIATFTFDRRGSSPGSITDLAVRLADSNGRPLQASVQIQNPAPAPADTQAAAIPPTQQPSAAGQATATAQQQAAAPVIIALPVGQPASPAQDVPRRNETAQQQTEGVPPSAPVPGETKPQRIASVEPSPVLPDPQKPAFYTQMSVLERFQAYKGERTPKALLALFEQEQLIGFRQDPKVVLADGKALATVSFVTAPTGTGSPAVKLQGAQQVSLEKDRENTNTWTMKARVAIGVVRASVEVTQKDLVMEFPLTVAPRVNADLDRSGKVTEEDFALFLKERGTAAAPKHDLNRDGKRDMTDEYIFTANYLAALLNPPPATTAGASAKPSRKAAGKTTTASPPRK